MLRPDAAILSAAPVKGVALLAGETPVGAAVPTGAAWRVLLTKSGGAAEAADAIGAPDGAIGADPTGAALIGAADGAGVTLTALVAASTGEETGAAELETTEAAAGELAIGTPAGELTIGAADGAGVELVTGLVKVQGQLVIVKVVAWEKVHVSQDFQIIQTVRRMRLQFWVAGICSSPQSRCKYLMRERAL